MALKEFIFQGFTSRTHALVLRELFDVPNIQRVLLSAAFVNESGVQQIEAKLKAHSDKTTVFAGIRNDITSHQGLALLHGVAADLYTVDTGSRNVLFHPKLYLVRGKTIARLLIGSANLTLGGLNNNVEAGAVLEFALGEATDRATVDDIEKQFAALPKDYPDHVVKVGTVADLDKLLDAGRLADEMAIAPPKPSTAAHGKGAGDAIPRIKLKVIPLYRALKAGAEKKPKAVKVAALAKQSLVTPAVGVQQELLWESKALTRRDLTIPLAKGTNSTGSVNLDKGLLPSEVDHRHYFRKQIFQTLKWVKSTKTTEKAFAKFHLVVKGISYGEFDLRIGHTIGTGSKGYKQKNAMTRLSWGPMHDYIAKPELIGRTLSLYRDKADPTRFMLDID